MATVTDPAAELGEIAARLAKGASQNGEQFLAQEFGVEPWSNEFVLILSAIYERIDLVQRIIKRHEEDEEVKAIAIAALDSFRTGFGGQSFRNHWNNSGNGLTAMKDNAASLKLLSKSVRPFVAYPKLDDVEAAEFLELIDAHLAQLEEDRHASGPYHQAIIDGLTKFRFQLRYLRWTGSGYLLEAFRNLVLLHNAVARQATEAPELNAEAALKGLQTLLIRFKETIDTAKGWAESAETLWKWGQFAAKAAPPLLGYVVGSNT